MLAITGTVMRVRGELVVVNPAKLYDGWLRYTEWEFQKTALYWAGKHAEQNAKLINEKSLAVAWMTGGLVLEIGLLVAWVALT